MGSHSLLQGIFPTQGSNLSLLHGRQILYHLSHQGSQCWKRGNSPELGRPEKKEAVRWEVGEGSWEKQEDRGDFHRRRRKVPANAVSVRQLADGRDWRQRKRQPSAALFLPVFN